MNPFRRRAEPTPAEIVEQFGQRLGFAPLTGWQRRLLAELFSAAMAQEAVNDLQANIRPGYPRIGTTPKRRGLFRRWRDRAARAQTRWAAEWIGRRYGRR